MTTQVVRVTFYVLGDLFSVALTPHNRWNGFKHLRERWTAHLEHILLRPVLLIDEAQEMPPLVLNELRLLQRALAVNCPMAVDTPAKTVARKYRLKRDTS